MAENRFDTGTSIRTPIARARGLGASGGGTEHFWQQRITAVANALLVFPFIIILAMTVGRPYEDAAAIMSHPLVAILSALFVLSIAIHMRLGMQIVIEDYVGDKGAKVAALVANTFFVVAVAATRLYAILKIGLSPLL